MYVYVYTLFFLLLTDNGLRFVRVRHRRFDSLCMFFLQLYGGHAVMRVRPARIFIGPCTYGTPLTSHDNGNRQQWHVMQIETVTVHELSWQTNEIQSEMSSDTPNLPRWYPKWRGKPWYDGNQEVTSC